jgi:hypothetical protein
LDSLVNQYGKPNALKIDVEGSELEVLEGAYGVLLDDNTKVIGIEIHTEILNARGIKNSHQRIHGILENNRFITTHSDFPV